MSNASSPSYSNENTPITSLPQSSNFDSNVSNTMNIAVNSSSSAISSSLETPGSQNSLNATADSKGRSNPLKYVEFSKSPKATSVTTESDLQPLNTTSLPYQEDNNYGRTFKFKDNKSANMGFLSSEKNVRLIDNINPTKLNSSLSNYNNNLEEIVSSVTGESVVPNSYNVFSSSKNN